MANGISSRVTVVHLHILSRFLRGLTAASYTHLRAHETREELVRRLLLDRYTDSKCKILVNNNYTISYVVSVCDSN
ncbi:hypothetical protein DW287_09000, partial [Haemophilus influenzae]